MANAQEMVFATAIKLLAERNSASGDPPAESPPPRCNDGLISYFCKDGGSRLHLECFPEENRRTKCDVFQIVFNGAPKTLDSLAPDWLEESGLRDLNVKH